MSNEEQMQSEFAKRFPIPPGVYFDLEYLSHDKYDPDDVNQARKQQARWEAWQACVAQYDGLMEDNQAFQREISALNQQVLELSAQVEVMREAMIELRSDFGMLPSHPCGPQMYNSIGDEINKALSITQSSALLAHDNEVAAKALEELLDKFAFFSSEDGLWLADAIQVIANERRNRK